MLSPEIIISNKEDENIKKKKLKEKNHFLNYVLKMLI